LVFGLGDDKGHVSVGACAKVTVLLFGVCICFGLQFADRSVVSFDHGRKREGASAVAAGAVAAIIIIINAMIILYARNFS
jgi:hypothetical protein